MSEKLIDQMTKVISDIPLTHDVGRIIAASEQTVVVSARQDRVCVGDPCVVRTRQSAFPGEVSRLEADAVHVLLHRSAAGIRVNDPVIFSTPPPFAPDTSWIGRVIDPQGRPLDGRPILPGLVAIDGRSAPTTPQARRDFGPRLETGLAVFNTLLPIVRGQRIGLFAGSGVGKSTLLADLARGVEADVIVIGLVGERGREIQHFVQHVLGAEGLRRSIVVAAASDQAPHLRRNCVGSAMSVAEYFRDQGKHVLLLIDSVTRFCEAHREVAVAAGEPANLRGFPASTNAAVASLCERAGPGVQKQGDITAVFTVLVAGSDMEEPVADMLRGVLDGHVVMERDIAERGRFPAINVLRSVSRSLPQAATDQENALISDARARLAIYDRAEMMIQAGLYRSGTDATIDQAVASFEPLDTFLSIKDARGALAHFAKLRQALASRPVSTQNPTGPTSPAETRG